MSYTDRDKLRPTNLTILDLSDALEQIPSGVNPQDYVANVLYKFHEEDTSQSLQTIKQKERESKTEAEILFGHLFEDAAPETILQTFSQFPEKLQYEPTVLKVVSNKLMKHKKEDLVNAFKSKLLLPSIRRLLDTLIDTTAGDEDKQKALKALVK